MRFLITILSMLTASPALAQSVEDTGPEWRVDLAGPGTGAALVLDDGAEVMLDIDATVRFGHVSGSGALVRANVASIWGLGGGFLSIEAAYFFRVLTSGDLRGGTALEMGGGPCLTPVGEIGANTYVSFQLRHYGFTAAIDLGYRALFDESRQWHDQHAVTLSLSLGFGFYG